MRANTPCRAAWPAGKSGVTATNLLWPSGHGQGLFTSTDQGPQRLGLVLDKYQQGDIVLLWRALGESAEISLNVR